LTAAICGTRNFRLIPGVCAIRDCRSSAPTLGDGRQSGTSDSPSILNASPESAAGGGLSWLRTGDTIRIELKNGRCDALVDDDEIARRKSEASPPIPESNTPWEELYREKTGQMGEGAVLEFAVPPGCKAFTLEVGGQKFVQALPDEDHDEEEE